MKDEIKGICLSKNYIRLVAAGRVKLIRNVKQLHMTKLKGWLFNFYSELGDFDGYDVINTRIIQYQNNIRKAASIDDIAFRNSMILERRQRMDY